MEICDTIQIYLRSISKGWQPYKNMINMSWKSFFLLMVTKCAIKFLSFPNEILYKIYQECEETISESNSLERDITTNMCTYKLKVSALSNHKTSEGRNTVAVPFFWVTWYVAQTNWPYEWGSYILLRNSTTTTLQPTHYQLQDWTNGGEIAMSVIGQVKKRLWHTVRPTP